MIARRQLLGLGLGVVMSPWARAQRSRVRRIGFLGNASASAFANHIAGLRAGLRENGYEERRNLSIDFRWSDGNVARLSELARELVRLPVEVLVTQGTPGTRAAMEATKTIPIVMAAVGDVVTTGLVANLARPGGNVTGMTFFAPELGGKRVELLKEGFPQVKRIGLFINPDNPIQGGPVRKAYETAAAAIRVELVALDLRSAAEFGDAFAEMRRRGVDAMLFAEEPVQIIHAGTLTALAARDGLPSIGPLEFLANGVTLAYGVSFPELYRRAGGFVARVLEGARPSDLPIERATRFEFVVNLATAKALGLSIAPAALQRADRVVQ